MQFVVFTLSAVLGCVVAAPSPFATCPNIISRSEWGARAPLSRTPLSDSPTPYVVIHHGESGPCSTQFGCSDIVRYYQNLHMDSNGWSDIGYNFIIGGDGNAYEGRGWDSQGAHAPGYNSQSIGICFIGSFFSELPNAAALDAAHKLIACGVTMDKIQAGYGLIGHRQAISTDCPGNALFAHIQGWDHWVDV